jgi:hypothetical protein
MPVRVKSDQSEALTMVRCEAAGRQHCIKTAEDSTARYGPAAIVTFLLVALPPNRLEGAGNYSHYGCISGSPTHVQSLQ